jgi:hypothetical protein
MVKRKYEHIVDRISRKLKNYFTVGVNVRFVLGTDLIADTILAIILEYVRESGCFVALHTDFTGETHILGVGFSYPSAQKIIIREMIDHHYCNFYDSDTDELDKLLTMIQDRNLPFLTKPKSVDDLSDTELNILCKSFDKDADNWYRIEESKLI